MTDILKRTTLMVRDAEKAARWYEAVLGMTRWMDVPYALSGEQLATGKKGDKTRLVIMQAEHDTIGMIGLLEWVDPPREDVPDELPKEIVFGAPIFVVATKDARATIERARAAGSCVHGEPLQWSVVGADGVLKDMLGASFWDLDGYFFEVNELLRVHEQ
jgi:catechol 2,3-dioxygenase-like lactoylglutathione lyase family enzyme